MRRRIFAFISRFWRKPELSLLGRISKVLRKRHEQLLRKIHKGHIRKSTPLFFCIVIHCIDIYTIPAQGVRKGQMLNSAGESSLLEIREKNICLTINIVCHRRTTICIRCQKVSRCFLPIRIVSIRIKSHKSHGTRSVFEILCRLKMNVSLPAICRIWITTKNSIQHRISREVGRGIALIPSPHRQIQATCHLRITIKSFRLDGQCGGRNIRLQNDLHIAGML